MEREPDPEAHGALYERNAVEDRFIDAELEARRDELVQAVEALMGKCAAYGAAHRVQPGLYELGDSDSRRNNPPEGERYERFEARREGSTSSLTESLSRTTR